MLLFPALIIALGDSHDPGTRAQESHLWVSHTVHDVVRRGVVSREPALWVRVPRRGSLLDWRSCCWRLSWRRLAESASRWTYGLGTVSILTAAFASFRLVNRERTKH